MLSFVIIASNAQETIQQCLDSIKDFNEVILYLNNSTDNTKKIAQKYSNVKIIEGEFLGFGKTKNRAISYATNNWIFVLDSDEVITKELKTELLEVLKNPKYNAYYVARLNRFFGKWIKHSGLFPDYTIRLFNKNFAKFNENIVHESVVYGGKKGYLKNYFLHFAYESIDEFIAKQNRYSYINAKHNRLKAIFSPYWTFIKIYFLKLGFLDGWHGFIIAKLYAQYTFWKYTKDKNES
jgi:glycosyltransferase involved in cell wall biosynthesis